MTIDKILNTTIDVYRSAAKSSTPWYQTTLKEFLHTMTMKNKLKIEYLRRLNMTDEKAAKQYKSAQINACTLSATFNRVRRIDCVDNMTGLIAIDIDNQDNGNTIDTDKAKHDVMTLPYVAMTMLSCRGQGIWCLIPYNINNDFVETFNALEQDFFQLGYIVDTHCKDVTRLRFCSYDNDIKIRTSEIEVYNRTLKKENNTTNETHLKDALNNVEYNTETWKLTKDDLRDICTAVYVLVKYCNYRSDTYNEWLLDGFRLATIPNHDIGLKLFMMISKASNGFKSEQDVCNKFTECCNRTTYRTNILGYYINKIKEAYGDDWRFRVNDVMRNKK